jgi:hypothetical protein
MNDLLLSFCAAVIGGLFTLVGGIFAHQHEIERQIKRDRLEMERFLDALETEIACCQVIFEQDFKKNLNYTSIHPKPENLSKINYTNKEDTNYHERYFFNTKHIITQDYFVIFNQNTNLVGRIDNKELRNNILNIYMTGKRFLDSLNYHTSLIKEYELLFAKNTIDDNVKTKLDELMDSTQSLITYQERLENLFLSILKENNGALTTYKKGI